MAGVDLSRIMSGMELPTAVIATNKATLRSTPTRVAHPKSRARYWASRRPGMSLCQTKQVFNTKDVKNHKECTKFVAMIGCA